MSDALGNRMKMYEKAEARRLIPLLPVLARLDGRSFSTFTRGLQKPYDERMVDLMQRTTCYLVETTNACIGYTQSDEITLVFYSSDPNSQIFFDGKLQKMVSTLAAMASVYFNSLLLEVLPKKAHYLPTFDCRVWQVPSFEEAANAVLWRELDATKNSIQSAARQYYSHKELLNKHTKEMQELLFVKGINWNAYPPFFKRGSYYQRRKVTRPFSISELDKLPEKHAARKNPNLMVERTEVIKLTMPPFSKVTNRVGVVLNGEDFMMEKKDEIQ